MQDDNGQYECLATEDFKETPEGSAERTAAHLGISVRALRLLSAAGCPSPIQYGPVARSQAQVAEFFGVSRRTICDWVQKGMPGSNGCYPLWEILEWRRRQPNPEPWHLTGNRRLEHRDASGDLSRAIYRTLRFDVLTAGQMARIDFMDGFMKIDPKLSRDDPNFVEMVETAFACSLAKHFEEFRP